MSSLPVATPFEDASYDAIVFDLGGVVLPLDHAATADALASAFGRDLSPLRNATAERELFDPFERGELSPEQFRQGLRERLSVPACPPSDDQIDQAWCQLLGTFSREHVQLLLQLRRSKRVVLLSNTNTIHARHFERSYAEEHESWAGPWRSLFDQVHYSFELGMRKPEGRVFTEVMQRNQLDPERTVLLDDNEDNVRSARSLGLRSYLHPFNGSLAPYFQLATAIAEPRNESLSAP